MTRNVLNVRGWLSLDCHTEKTVFLQIYNLLSSQLVCVPYLELFSIGLHRFTIFELVWSRNNFL